MRRCYRWVPLAVLAAWAIGGWAEVAHAALDPAAALTYLPAGFVGSLKSEAQVDGYLADLDRYGIGQILLELPAVRRNGAMRFSETQLAMMDRWVQRAAAYQAVHGVAFEITAVINCLVPRVASLNRPRIRANIVGAVRGLITEQHLQGVNLDFEPYPVSRGFLRLLDDLHAMFADVGFTGRLSVVAPVDLSRWSASYWASVGARATQVDPLFYDSTITSEPEYEHWVRDGLAQISGAVPQGTLIVPVLASYASNAWHDPAVENVSGGAAALQASLDSGSRIHGAGVWWWWGLFYDEGGSYDAGADRSAWQDQVRALDYTPR